MEILSSVHRRASSSHGYPYDALRQSPVASGSLRLVYLKAAGVSHNQLNEFLIFGKFVWFGFEVKIDRFTDILKRLFFCLSLGPTALQRRNVRDKVTILARFQDNLDVH